MEMKTFKAMAKAFSPKIALRIRGRHGIGKSQSVYQIAAELGLEVVERRLSQMTEGDIIGLPVMEAGSTQFKPCDWLVDCCHNPRLLFLDELNRALPGVEQATFQLADSRKFYGYELHKDTRIIIAENIGDQYQVQSSDPAAISRYAVVDLEPTVDEWLEFAGDHCHPALVEFIRTNPGLLEHSKIYEPNVKYPDRRAWHRLDQELQSSGLMDDPANEIFYAMAMSMVGPPAAIAYQNFCKARDQQISAKDILADWAKAKKRMGKGTNEKYVDAIGKLTDFLKINLLEDTQAEQFAKFMRDCPAEPRMAAWSALNINMQNLFAVHPYVEDLMVETATGEQLKNAQTIQVDDAASKGKKKK
jgi:hypothetical protein